MNLVTKPAAPHILIVDDDERIRELLRRFLEPEGYRVTEAVTAEDGARAIQASDLAVAFCDLHMPGANGLWLADQIRTLSPATAIVLATGDSAVPPMESMRPGVIAYVLKPLSRRHVVAAANDGVQWSANQRRRGVGRREKKLLDRPTDS